MRAHRAIIALVILNLVVLTVQLAHARPASLDPIAPVLRGRALELVDERGRVRAEIKVLPAQPHVKMPDGTTGMPETVQLRLINSAGSPHVKLVAPEDGSALVLGGEAGAYVQIRSRGTDPTVKIHHGDGRDAVIAP